MSFCILFIIRCHPLQQLCLTCVYCFCAFLNVQTNRNHMEPDLANTEDAWAQKCTCSLKIASQPSILTCLFALLSCLKMKECSNVSIDFLFSGHGGRCKCHHFCFAKTFRHYGVRLIDWRIEEMTCLSIISLKKIAFLINTCERGNFPSFLTRILIFHEFEI